MKKVLKKSIAICAALAMAAALLTACGPTEKDDQNQDSRSQVAVTKAADDASPVTTPDIPQYTYANGDVSYTMAKDDETQAQSNGTVYFDDPIGWGDTYIYYWSDANKNMVKWPGVKMESFEGVWRYTLPEGVQYIIFSNGAMQTRDVPYNPAQTNYRLSSERDQDNSYYVEDWQGNIINSDRVDPYDKY